MRAAPWSLRRPLPCGWGIIAPRMKGVTASQAGRRQPGTSPQPVLEHRLPCVLRACRRKAAGAREQRREQPLIGRNDACRHDRRPHREARALGIADNAPRSCVVRAANGSVRTVGRPTTTRAACAGAASRLTRYASRRRRRTRLRCTAFLSCRLTANPARVGSAASRHSTMSAGRSMRLPRWKSA